jgi:hypothetical protein
MSYLKRSINSGKNFVAVALRVLLPCFRLQPN